MLIPTFYRYFRELAASRCGDLETAASWENLQKTCTNGADFNDQTLKHEGGTASFTALVVAVFLIDVGAADDDEDILHHPGPATLAAAAADRTIGKSPPLSAG
jgi:hypothetical protein